jgi:hypothetical protein
LGAVWADFNDRLVLPSLRIQPGRRVRDVLASLLPPVFGFREAFDRGKDTMLQLDRRI